MKWLAAFLFLLADAATALQIVNLKSLSPDGEQAIVTYDKLWVEIDLSLDGGARPLPPPQQCEWTSMAYAPASGALAMVAFCPGPVRECAEGAARLMIREGAGPAREVLFKEGARWGAAYWHAGQRRLVLIETQIKPPEFAGLDDLNRSVRRCGWRDATIEMADIDRGRLISLDILPGVWRPKQIVSADDEALTAVIGARAGADDGSPAARDIAATCASLQTAPAGLRAVCTGRGYDLLMTWADGEWSLGVEGAKTAKALHGRAIATPDRAIIGKENCRTSLTKGLVGLACKLVMKRNGETFEIAAPEGLFGDLALSGDGATLAAIYAGRSIRNRRFDIWDLETRERRSLAPLLDAVAHFGAWPPER